MSDSLPYETSLREWMRRRGMRCERLRYARAEAGGSAVAYRLSPAAPPRAVLLVAHGAGNDALYAMVGLFKRLLRRGVELFAFDMDGHGRHSDTLLCERTVRGAVPAALAQATRGRNGVPVHALGVSLGGSILLRTLADLPGRFMSAALVVAPLRIEFSGGSVLNELGMPGLRTLWRERAEYGLWGLVPSFGPVKRGVYPLRLRTPRPGSFGYVGALNEMIAGFALDQAAPAVETPTLLVYGGKDRIVPPAQGERLGRLLPAARLLRLERETHLSTPMAPAAVAALVRHFTRPPGSNAP